MDQQEQLFTSFLIVVETSFPTAPNQCKSFSEWSSQESCGQGNLTDTPPFHTSALGCIHEHGHPFKPHIMKSKTQIHCQEIFPTELYRCLGSESTPSLESLIKQIRNQIHQMQSALTGIHPKPDTAAPPPCLAGKLGNCS